MGMFCKCGLQYYRGICRKCEPERYKALRDSEGPDPVKVVNPNVYDLSEMPNLGAILFKSHTTKKSSDVDLAAAMAKFDEDWRVGRPTHRHSQLGQTTNYVYEGGRRVRTYVPSDDSFLDSFYRTNLPNDTAFQCDYVYCRETSTKGVFSKENPIYFQIDVFKNGWYLSLLGKYPTGSKTYYIHFNSESIEIFIDTLEQLFNDNVINGDSHNSDVHDVYFSGKLPDGYSTQGGNTHRNMFKFSSNFVSVVRDDFHRDITFLKIVSQKELDGFVSLLSDAVSKAKYYYYQFKCGKKLVDFGDGVVFISNDPSRKRVFGGNTARTRFTRD